MDIFALTIALVALVLSAMAFGRTGGLGTLQQQTEEARRLAANALGRVEDAIRPHRNHKGEALDASSSQKGQTAPAPKSTRTPDSS